MAEDMIERVADVLLNAGCGDSAECEAITRLVLTVMREPTDKMVRTACFRTCSRWGCTQAKRCVGNAPVVGLGKTYAAMIDAALSGDPQ